jgi:serine/threonine protein phosphatase 1
VDSDKLILLGDYVDRGGHSKLVVEQVKNMVNNYGVVAIRGNHDQMFLDALFENDDANFIHNGGMDTIESYLGEDCVDFGVYLRGKEHILKNHFSHVNFLRTLPYYYETEDHIFVHAGINPTYAHWKEQPKDDFIWIRDMFINNSVINTDGKIVVFGHTPTINLQETADIFVTSDKIGIDGGCCFGYQLNCLEITDDEYIQHFVNRKKTVI